MQIDSVDFRDGRLVLSVPDRREALKFKYEFKAGNYDFTRHRERRSLSANSYAWALMAKIAERIGISKEEVYRNEIRDITGKTELLWCRSAAVDAFREAWIGNHIGRFADVIEDNGEDATILVTYGSSDYDTAQMAKLIDNILQDCRELEIETKSEEEIRSLLEAWDGRG